jgi:antitoxin ParD1/3/4
MPIRSINLTRQMDSYVEAKIRSGEYANASEVVRAGLRTLEQAEREDLAQLEALRSAVSAGEANGIVEGDVLGEVRERIGARAMGTGRT